MPAIPWRRQGVRHTSNELYVDIVESLSVTVAPSGRLLSAISHGSIVFTAKISGVPDLLLSLSAPGGQMNISHKLQLPVFHPCVRLARWRESPGELSFIPPDGRFVLAGYEVDLLPIDPTADEPPTYMEKPFLPVSVDLQKSLGPNASDFEVKLTLNTNFPGTPSSKGIPPGRGSGTSTPSFLGTGSSANSNSPSLEEVVVTIPISPHVRNITEMRPSRGEAHFTPGSDVVEWRVPTKDTIASISRTATLRCTVVGSIPANGVEEEQNPASQPYRSNNPLLGYYDEGLTHSEDYQDNSNHHNLHSESQATTERQSARKSRLMSSLMPDSASVSFTVRGWLPSGIRVDGLVIDMRRSRGLGEGVKPYKGVKYVCVSRNGIEKRC